MSADSDATDAGHGPSAEELAHDLLVVGLARNCGSTLPGEVQRIRQALPAFRRIHWCVVESDSSDDTLAVLARLEREVPGFRFLSLGALRPALPQRTARIAFCRNAYLEHLRHDRACADVRYVVVADLDGSNTHLTAAALASCWRRHDWDACMANQAGPYYDIWALRHPLWSPGDCWQQARFLASLGQDEERAKMATVFARMVTLAPTAPWVEVESAFGGLAIYRAEALRTGSYVGLSPQGEEICEHVALHATLRAGGRRLFVNPALVNSDSSHLAEYWPERAQIERASRGPLFRTLLRVFYGHKASRELRRLLRSLS
jgi:hypothetical protein